MASLVAPDASRIAASILFLAALAVSPLVFCQPVFEPVARDGRQLEIVDRLREEQELNGVYSAALVEPLTALSFLYQESGDRDLAIAAIKRALQVQRANYGLRTLDQAPLMLQWIETAETMRDFRMAWDLERALLALAHRNPNDLRAVPILREIRRLFSAATTPRRGTTASPRTCSETATPAVDAWQYKGSFGRRSDITGKRSR
jgi:hypothetical protein